MMLVQLNLFGPAKEVCRYEKVEAAQSCPQPDTTTTEAETGVPAAPQPEVGNGTGGRDNAADTGGTDASAMSEKVSEAAQSESTPSDESQAVETEIPEEEMTSGYKAEKAKDAVGEVRWKGGPVDRKLPEEKRRRVMLSRYDKPIRIVPESEVAEMIAARVGNTPIPENVVTPALKAELEKRGVKITESEDKHRTLEGEQENYELSDVRDENGHKFVKVPGKKRSIQFGKIRKGMGLISAPIRLSEGENGPRNGREDIGYGLKHMEARHGEEIIAAGYSSVPEFVRAVAQGFTEIRTGYDGDARHTFLLLKGHNGRKDATLYIELSREGAYWNVNSGGIFGNNYTKKKNIVWPLPAVGHSTNADAMEVVSSPAEAVKSETGDGGNSPQTMFSEGEGSNISESEQENGEKSSEINNNYDNDTTKFRKSVEEDRQ